MAPHADDDGGLRAACLAAARATIAERGLEQLSLREVARRLGVSHQAPYKHFASRDHLLAEVIRQCFQDFARHLDDREAQEGPQQDLACLGTQYLAYALAHPLEYRLMFNTTWPEPAEEVGLVQDALHAFNILRDDLKRIHGVRADSPGPNVEVDQDAMLIWSAMHGLSSILQSSAMLHLDLAPGVRERVPQFIMDSVRGLLQSREDQASQSPAAALEPVSRPRTPKRTRRSPAPPNTGSS